MSRIKECSGCMGVLLIAVMAMVFVGCSEDSPTGPGLDTVPSKAVYIINGLAETLSVFDIEQETMTNDVLTVGKWPNAIAVRGDRAYAVNSGDHTVQVIDLDAMESVGTIDLGAGANPMQIAFLSDQKAYVTNNLTNTVAVVDLGAMTVTKTIAVGMTPTSVVVSEGKVYVGNTAFQWPSYGEGTVSVISTETDEVVGTIPVGINPQFAGVDASGRVHVVCTGDYAEVEGAVYVIDPSSDTVSAMVSVGGAPGAIAITPDGRAYLTSASGLLAYETSDGSVVHSGSEPMTAYAGASGITVGSTGRLYVCVPDWTSQGLDKLMVVDGISEELLGTYTPGGGAQCAAVR